MSEHFSQTILYNWFGKHCIMYKNVYLEIIFIESPHDTTTFLQQRPFYTVWKLLEPAHEISISICYEINDTNGLKWYSRISS